MPPVIQRELLIAARAPSLFRARIVAASVGVAMGCFGMLVGVGAGSGKRLFLWMVALALLASLIEGLRKAAACIADEREQGTLGLLFLTDLRGHDVVLGKLSAIAIRSFHGLLAFFPVLAIAVLLGGVTSGELVRVACVLVSALMMSLCIGIFCSVCSANAGRAAINTVLFLCAVGSLGPLAMALGGNPSWRGLSVVSLISPLRLSGLATQFAYGSRSSDFWLGLGLQFVFSAGLLAASSWRLPRRLQDAPGRAFGLPRWAARSALLGKLSARDARTATLLLNRNPLQWLAWRNRGNRMVGWLFALVIVVVGGFALAIDVDAGPPLAMLATLVLRVWAVYVAAGAGFALKSDEAMELMLVTPLNGEEAVRTVSRAVWRVIAPPFVAICAMTVIACLMELRMNPTDVSALGATALTLGVVAIGIGSSIGAGLWCGLKEKAFGRAFVMALIRTLLPIVLCCWGIVLADLFWLGFSGREISKVFRKRILDHYTGGDTLRGTLPPLPAGSGPPPIIGS